MTEHRRCDVWRGRARARPASASEPSLGWAAVTPMWARRKARRLLLGDGDGDVNGDAYEPTGDGSRVLRTAMRLP